MPFIRKGKRKSRRNKVTVGAIIPKKMVKGIKKIARNVFKNQSELKEYLQWDDTPNYIGQIKYNTTTYSSGHLSSSISTPSQGTDYDDRIGDTIKLQQLKLNLQFFINPTDPAGNVINNQKMYHHIRVFVVRVKLASPLTTVDINQIWKPDVMFTNYITDNMSASSISGNLYTSDGQFDRQDEYKQFYEVLYSKSIRLCPNLAGTNSVGYNYNLPITIDCSKMPKMKFSTSSANSEANFGFRYYVFENIGNIGTTTITDTDFTRFLVQQPLLNSGIVSMCESNLKFYDA